MMHTYRCTAGGLLVAFASSKQQLLIISRYVVQTYMDSMGLSENGNDAHREKVQHDLCMSHGRFYGQITIGIVGCKRLKIVNG
jgi:hypothetical protein